VPRSPTGVASPAGSDATHLSSWASRRTLATSWAVASGRARVILFPMLVLRHARRHARVGADSLTAKAS
jgi:hypothetical protein